MNRLFHNQATASTAQGKNHRSHYRLYIHNANVGPTGVLTASPFASLPLVPVTGVNPKQAESVSNHHYRTRNSQKPRRLRHLLRGWIPARASKQRVWERGRQKLHSSAVLAPTLCQRGLRSRVGRILHEGGSREDCIDPRCFTGARRVRKKLRTCKRAFANPTPLAGNAPAHQARRDDVASRCSASP